jgi:aminopeptidase N
MKILHSYIHKVLVLSLILCSTAAADHYARNTGIDIQHYTFKLTLSDSTDLINGEAEIEIKSLKNGISKFCLDLSGLDSSSKKGMKVSRVEQGGKVLTFHQLSDQLEIETASPSIKDELKNFVVTYSGVPADGLIISKNKYGDRTFFGDNWPNRAHCWLPVIDHPYDKATCDFIITAPAEYKIIANGILVEQKNIGNSFCITHWKENVPIPTKVMVIGAAKFAVQSLQDSGSVPVESWVYPQDSVKGFYDLSPAKDIVKLFSVIIGIFPYEKLANVESKTIYGGMENASAIFYAENEISGTRKSLVTVAHEIAHQWFGDAVTEGDWSHIWLSEGFATYFQNIFIEHQFGKDSLLKALELERKQIIRYNQVNPDAAVVDNSTTNLTDLLNVNSYQKGGWILRMLQHTLGDTIFRKGIRLYYNTYLNRNALTKDFESVMEKASGRNLKWFFNEWLYKPGLPRISGKWNYDKKSKQLIVKLEQTQGKYKIFNMPIDLGIYFNNGENAEIKKVETNAAVNVFKFQLKQKPARVTPDPGKWLLMDSDFRED